MTEPAKAYLAAMIDAEGCVGLAAVKSRTALPEFPLGFIPRVLVTNSHLGLLELIKSVVGYGTLYHAKKNSTNPNWSPIHRWTAAANHARQLLADVLPYLVIKRRQAELVIAFPKRTARGAGQGTVYATQRAMFDECAALNLRGLKLAAVTTFPADHPLTRRTP